MQLPMGARGPNAAERRPMLSPTTSAATLPPATSSSPPPPPFSIPRDTTIVLVHGLGRTPRSMSRLASRLERATGLRAKTVGYPSRRLSVAEAARVVAERSSEACGGPGRPAFAVTFSLGGPVLRHAAAMRSEGGAARAGGGGSHEGDENNDGGAVGGFSSPDWIGSVLLAPPNRGSDLARALMHSPSTPSLIRKAFRFIYGPAAIDLALSVDEIVRVWPDAPRPCGVIAGTAPRSFNPASLILASRVFGGGGKGRIPGSGVDERHRDQRTHDGTVAVDETRLSPPADDFATVHAGHTFLADRAETAELVASFVLSGRFVKKTEGEKRGERKET